MIFVHKGCFATHLELILSFFLIGTAFFSLELAIGCALALSCLFWYFCLSRRTLFSKNAVVVLCFFLILSGLAGYLRISHEFNVRAAFSDVMRRHPHIIAYGELITDPVAFSQGSAATMQVEKIIDNRVSFAAQGSLRLSLPSYPEYWRGQQIVVEGEVEWSAQSNMWQMPTAQVKSAKDPVGVFGIILDIRREVVRQMQLLFPGSAGGFLVGLVAGGSRGVSSTVFQDVRATGLTHLIAVSGYNVTLVLNLVLSLFAWVPRKWKILPVGCMLFLFLLLVGLSGSALRAALMGFLAMYALSAGRKRSITLALLWSAIAMLLWQPFMLLEDRGFQLSFLATIGVCYLAPEVMGRVGLGKEHEFLKNLFLDPFLTTLAVYLVTIPVLFSFQQFSLIGLVTNVVFVPFIPFFMLLASCVFLISFLFWPLGFFLGRFGTILVDCYFSLMHWFAMLPFSNIPVPQLSPWAVMIYGNLLMFLYFFLRRPAVSIKPRLENRPSRQ